MAVAAGLLLLPGPDRNQQAADVLAAVAIRLAARHLMTPTPPPTTPKG